MSDPIDTIEKGHGITIEIHPDPDPMNPREWDNFGTMVCWHRQYSLGEEQPKVSGEEWHKAHPRFYKDNLVIPIMAYEHGGITIRAYDYGNWPDQQWDCGQLGFIYVSKDKIRSEFGVKKISKKAMDRARGILESEIEVYDDYLTGNVYGYVIKNSDDEILDSCFGYFGYDGEKYMRVDAENAAKHFVEKAKEEADAIEQRMSFVEVGSA